jgi:integral membrane sensor domain MASE1
METRASRWPVVLGLAAAYLLTARLGLTLALPPDYKATAIWPPSGLALAALLLYGRRAWPGVWVGAFLANVWDALDPARAGSAAAHPLAAAAIATGSTVQAVASAWLTRRYAGPAEWLATASHAFRFVAVVSAVCLIASTAGAATLWAAGLPGPAVPTAWWTWWLGDLVGVLVVAPAVLAFARPGAPVRRPAAGAAAALTAALFAVCGPVFGGWGPVQASPLAYLSLPLVVWAAVRFGARGAALAVLAVAAFAVWGTVRGTGPFVHADVHQSLLLLDVFLAVAVTTALALCAVLREREAAQAALRAGEARSAAVTEAMPQIVWTAAPDGATVYLNRRWAEYTGLAGPARTSWPG